MIQSQLIEYVIYMKEELKLSRNTIYSRLSAVQKFYETNDIELRWKKIKSYVGHGGKKRSKKDRPYTHVEIAKMIEEADQKGKDCNSVDVFRRHKSRGTGISENRRLREK